MMDENDTLLLLHIAQQTGQLGRAGFARQSRDIGFHPTMAAARRAIDAMVEQLLLRETPGTAYLCITIEGVETLRKNGRI